MADDNQIPQEQSNSTVTAPTTSVYPENSGQTPGAATGYQDQQPLSATPPPSFVSQPPTSSTFPAQDTIPASQTPADPLSPPPPVFTQASTSADSGPMVAHFKHKRNPLGGVLIILALLILLGGAAFFFINNRNQTQGDAGDSGGAGIIPKQQLTLTYWGLWEPTSVMQSIISEYQTQNPNIIINYVEQTKQDYRQRLQNSLENGTGPDIFRYHNTWFPMLKQVMQSDSKNGLKRKTICRKSSRT
jgi:hypothetical protein